MLKLPDAQWTNTLEEVYKHLLEIHFPGCQTTRDINDVDETSPSRFPKWIPSSTWDVANEVVTHDRVQWAITSMAPYKSPCMDGIYPILLQRGLQYLITHICSIYKASLPYSYIGLPKVWQISKVAFIPKLGRTDYSIAKAYRLISLTLKDWRSWWTNICGTDH